MLSAAGTREETPRTRSLLAWPAPNPAPQQKPGPPRVIDESVRARHESMREGDGRTPNKAPGAQKRPRSGSPTGGGEGAVPPRGRAYEPNDGREGTPGRRRRERTRGRFIRSSAYNRPPIEPARPSP